jgi:hypothetical protein
MTTTLIVLFNLKPGVSVEDYEQFARHTDIPAVKALKSVDDFTVFKTAGLFGSDARPPYQYVELIPINDMDGFLAALPEESIQRVAAQFGEFADNPIFMLTNEL